jgi:hypothetical protein
MAELEEPANMAGLANLAIFGVASAARVPVPLSVVSIVSGDSCGMTGKNAEPDSISAAGAGAGAGAGLLPDDPPQPATPRRMTTRSAHDKSLDFLKRVRSPERDFRYSCANLLFALFVNRLLFIYI